MPIPLRVALFSGNYNYVLDGANQALNRLVGHLEQRGISVRVYAPTVPEPAFAPAGTLVSVPSVPVPGRSEYRIALGLPPSVRADLEAFNPTLVHIAAPDWLGWAALGHAERAGVPAVASVHTRFETYARYYGGAWAEPAIAWHLRRTYNRCAALLAPTECMRAALSALGVTRPIALWTRGVDRGRFNPARRCSAVRAALGYAPEHVVIGFTGRLVREKGLDQFADAFDRLERRCPQVRALIVGDGPERARFARRLPRAHFAGFLDGSALAQAYAAMDLFLNPSVTEAFGNVTLEAMASGVPVVAADATGTRALVRPDVSGVLVEPGRPEAFADAAAALIADPARRAVLAAGGLALAARHDWETILDGVIAQYRSVLADPATVPRRTASGEPAVPPAIAA